MLPRKMVKVRITGLISTNSEIDFVQSAGFLHKNVYVAKENVFAFNIKIRRLKNPWYYWWGYSPLSPKASRSLTNIGYHGCCKCKKKPFERERSWCYDPYAALIVLERGNLIMFHLLLSSYSGCQLLNNLWLGMLPWNLNA